MQLVQIFVKKNLFWYLLLFLIVFITYNNIWSIYFQQDEWFWFKKIILFDQHGILSHFQVVSNHFVPFFSLQFDAMMRLFRFNELFYGIYDFILHYINVILVFIFAKKFFNNEKIGLLSAILFAVAATPLQAVVWYGTSPMSLPSAAIGLCSMIVFHSYLGEGNKKYLFSSLMLLVVGSLFYESVLAMFLFITFWSAISKRYVLQTFTSTTITGILFVTFRSLMQIREGITIQTSYGIYVNTIISNIIHFPLIGFSQLFVPSVWFYKYSLSIIQIHGTDITKLLGPQLQKQFNITTTMNALFMSLSVIFLIALGIFFLLPLFEKKEKKEIFLFFVFIFVNLLPFTLLPNSGLESRHFYFLTVGSSMMVATIFYRLYKKINFYTAKTILIILFFSYIIFNIQYVREAVNSLVTVSMTRKQIVNQLLTMYPKIPAKAIFFSTAGELPFQSGVGEMLMVNYSNEHPYYVFFDSEFLTHMGEEGYSEKQNVGFGYFYTFDKLQKAYIDYKLTPDAVDAFEWNNNTHEIVDKSSEIRNRLANITTNNTKQSLSY